MELQQLWGYFKMWIAKARSDQIEVESAFLCICPDGTGWIGDGAGNVAIEFDSIEDGIRQLLPAVMAAAR